MGKRCYLHSVQQSYENNSCKPEIKYFTGAGHCRGNTFLSIFLCKAVVYRCKPVANTPKVCWNKLFGKLCLVDWLVLEYIEWKVQLTQINIFDTIEMIYVVQ